MRSVLFAALSLSLATSATAQTFNYFGIWACTNYTSRGALGTNAGDNLLQIRGSHFSGIGQDDAGIGTVLTGFRHYLQDQNAATVEMYNHIIRADDPSLPNSPDCSPAGLLLNTSPISSPGGGGTVAWYLTYSLGTPSNVLPVCSTYYVGLSFPANANWTTDGLSSHIGTYYILGTTQADNPAQNAPNVAWNCLAGAATQATSARTIRYELQVNSAILNLANTDPTLLGNTSNCVSGQLDQAGNPRSYGAGGLWPQNGGPRRDGINARVYDSASPNGPYVVFLGLGSCPGTPLAALFTGAVFLNPLALTAVASGVLDAAGQAQPIILPPNTIPGNIVNRPLNFQAITVRSTLQLPGRMTNMASTVFLP